MFAGHPGASPLKVEPHASAPTLQSIAREGDPSGAVSLAIQTASSREAIGLGGLLRARLSTRKPDWLGVHSLGVTVTRFARTADEAEQFLLEVKRALERPVTASDGVGDAVRLLLDEERSHRPSASNVEACWGVLGTDMADLGPMDVAEVEDIRARVGSRRVGLGALGTREIREAAGRAQRTGWSTGTEVDPPSKTSSPWTVREGPATLVRVAVQTPRVGEALAVAKALADDMHPLRAKVEALARRFKFQDAHVTIDPGGACVGITLVQADEPGRAPVDTLAQVLLAAETELKMALDGSRATDDLALSILAPESPLEAVSLAAWTAAPMRLRDREVWLREAVVSPTANITAEQLERSVSHAISSSPREELGLRRRAEIGQPESWLLLASSCGLGSETAEEAGFRAATVEALALGFSGNEGVTLEPWYGPEGVGLMAHARRQRGESARSHALRLARRTAMALWGRPVDGRDVARARAELLAKIGEDPARKLALTVLGGEHPSLLDARGQSASLGRLSSLDVEEVRGELAAEPLRAAFLDSADSDQSAAVLEGLHSWFRVGGPSPVACRTSKPLAAPPGLWRIASASASVQASRWLGMATQGPVEGGLALEYLLGRKGGYLEQALGVVPAHFEVGYWGGEAGGALVVRVTGEPWVLDSALGTVRAQMDRLSQTGISAVERKMLAKRYREGLLQRSLSPRGRAIDLWKGEPPPEFVPELVAPHLRGLAAREHRVIEVNTKQ
jgi:hypothetical protein